MDSYDQVDGVFAGRYVLVEYDTALNATAYDKGWYLVSKNGQHIAYQNINNCVNNEDSFYLTFQGPVASSHCLAEDITVPILYFAPHKHFTILNSSAFYIKATKDGSYTEVSQAEYEEATAENLTTVHAHIANNVACFDHIEVFTEEDAYIYAEVPAGYKYTYNEGGEYWSVSKTETFTIREDQNTVYTYKYLTQLSVADSTDYLINFAIDNNYYNTSRGYDSTVWQKVYSNGVEKYVMIAELNTVVPTFGVTPDAPSLLPISPHFGADSTNVYYDLHWQPAWGFRVKAASNEWNVSQIKPNGQLVLRNENNINSQINNVKTRKKDTVFYPSDQFMTWSQTFEDSTIAGDSKRKTLYYNSETQAWDVEDTSQLPAAIYFNKDGFSSSEISYSEDLTSEESRTSNWGKYNSSIANSNWENNDAITITPTGLSGNSYNAHDGSIDRQFKEDIQELSIMLPSVGDTMARIWDLVYGGRDTTEGIRVTNLRNKEIAWEDAKVEPSRRGLRLTGQGGDEYNTTQVDTLAGAINTAHDLIGMIISSNTSEELEDLEDLDKNRIYYDSDHKKYFRKHETYRFTPLAASDFEYPPTLTGLELSQAEIDKGLYYIKVNNEYVLATQYDSEVQYYIKKIKTPYEALEYELTQFPYTDNQNRQYLWYQDYIGENTRYVEDLDSSLKELRSDYIYDPVYHSDRSYYYINPEPVTLTASYAPKKYWYKLVNNNTNIFKLDTAENQTRGRVYYRFNPSNLPKLNRNQKVYVPGLYYFKRRSGAGENDYSYELDVSENRSQNYLNGNSEVYKENGSVRYYLLDIAVIKNSDGEEIIYKIHQIPEPANVTSEADFLNDVLYYQDNNGEYQKATEYVEGTEYYYMKTTYERTSGEELDVHELDPNNPIYANDLLLHREQTFYTAVKDTNGNIVTLVELTRQELLNRRDEISHQDIYGLGLRDDLSRPYMTMGEAEEAGIINRQDEFYQSNTYHYERNNTYILDTSPQYTEGRQYYIINDMPIRLSNNLHFYEADQYYTEAQNEEGFDLVSSSTMPANTTFYKKNEYFVMADTRNILPYGSKWNLDILAIPKEITLGKKTPRYELIELPNYSVNTNTLNGMLIRIHQLLEPNDTLTRSSENVSGIMNQMKDLLASFSITKAREFVIVDDYGRYHNAPFTGDAWLKLTVDGDPETPSINIQHLGQRTLGTASRNLNDIDSNDPIDENSVVTYDVTTDDKGHVTNLVTRTTRLPDSWKTITSTGISEAIADLAFNERDENNNIVYASKVAADNCIDSLQINPGNKWIKMLANDTSSDSLTIAHTVNTININEKDDTDLNKSDGAITLQDIDKDEAGHITKIQPHKYLLPHAWRDIHFGNDTISSDSYVGTLNLDNDDWTEIALINESELPAGTDPRPLIKNTVKITHADPQTTANQALIIPDNVTPKFGDTFEVPTFKVDTKGHISDSGTKTVTIPSIILTVANQGALDSNEQGTGNIVTSVSYDNQYQSTKGNFTVNRDNVGTLTIAEFTALNNNYNGTLVLADTDSINTAFAKLQKRIAEEETNRVNAINALDVDNVSDITGFGKDKTLATLTETDGKIAATFQSIYITSAAVKVGQTATQGNEEPQDITLANWIDSLDYTGTGLAAGKTLSAFVQEDGKVSLSTQDIAITVAQITNFNDKVNEIIQGLNCNNAINSDEVEVHLLKSLSETNGVISYTSEKLAWSHISPLLPTGDNAFVTVGGLTITLGDYSLGTHTHDLGIAVDKGESSITLASNGKYKLTAGGKTYIFTMGNFAAAEHNHNGTYAPLSHEHDATDITSGTLNIDRIPDLSSNYATSTHNHLKADITDLEDLSVLSDIGTIDTYDASINPQGIIGQVITPATSDDPETPEDEIQAAVTTQNLVDYIKWLEARITALENNS